MIERTTINTLIIGAAIVTAGAIMGGAIIAARPLSDFEFCFEQLSFLLEGKDGIEEELARARLVETCLTQRNV